MTPFHIDYSYRAHSPAGNEVGFFLCVLCLLWQLAVRIGMVQSQNAYFGFRASQDLNAGACGWFGARSRTLLKQVRVFSASPNV